MRSESTSAYVQGRNRLPLAVLQHALCHVCHRIAAWHPAETLTWNGHAVRIVDGRTADTGGVGIKRTRAK